MWKINLKAFSCIATDHIIINCKRYKKISISITFTNPIKMEVENNCINFEIQIFNS